MTRRRSTPWIYRAARPLIGAIAGLGILNTGYITYNKLSSTAVACPAGGCERVLESAYGNLFGLPLSLFGLLAYLAMAVLALSPLLINPDEKKTLRNNLENNTWLLMFALATGMLLFSGYLMYIMFSKFVAPFGANGLCYFCIASATFATIIFVLTLLGKDWNDRGQLFFLGTIVAMITLIGSIAWGATVGQAPANANAITDARGTPYYLLENTSGEAELQLARHLKQTGAVMYGAYTCSHCCAQKELFGKEATKEFTYVECIEGGKNAQPDVCQTELTEASKQLGQPAGFPTWKVGGKYYSGRQGLQQLASASGYTGPQDFKNALKECRRP
jgi:uncharacterized membrane protein